MSDDAPPPRSHNMPPELVEPGPLIIIDGLPEQLAKDWAHKVTREAELHAGFLRFQTATLKVDIGDAAFAQKATDFASQIRGEWAQTKELHKKVKDPVLAAGRAIDAFWLRGIVEPLKADLDAVLSWLTRHQRHVAHQAALKAADERQRQQDEADRLAKLAAQTQAPEAVEKAIEAEQAAYETATAPPPAPIEVSRVRGDMGGVASLSGTWEVVIDNPDLIPREYLVPSMPLLEARMKASRIEKGPPTAVIPGVHFELKQNARIR